MQNDFLEKTLDHPDQLTIQDAFLSAQAQSLTPQDRLTLKPILENILLELQMGNIRVSYQNQNPCQTQTWITVPWIKQAISLCFQIFENDYTQTAIQTFRDKIPLQFQTPEHFKNKNIRLVPQATVRAGAYIGQYCILMPCYVNIGAYIDTGCLIDTWATIGSCAQIGKNVHISGGAGIGGVLEPIQQSPTIIEDNCFIGARSEIVEGVVIETGSVISMGVFLGQSTKIYNRMTGEITMGRVPAGSVVVPGSIPSADGSHSTYSAIIIKTVDAKTRAKTSLNDLLRDPIA